MEYLKEFKSFHTEDQKKLFDFIKRYQKTSYVSKNKKKLLDDVGLPFKDFNNLFNKIRNILDFFKSNNMSIFEDIFDSENDDYIGFKFLLQYKIAVKIKGIGLSHDTTSYIEISDIGDMEFYHWRADDSRSNIYPTNNIEKDEFYVIESILKSVIGHKETSILKANDMIKNDPMNKRAGIKDIFGKDTLNRILIGNPFRKLEIYPIFDIMVCGEPYETSYDDDNAERWSDRWTYKVGHKKTHDIENLLKICISRYLNIVKPIPYNVSIMDYINASYNMSCKYEVKFDI